jgi:hypothetical protein
MPSVTLVDRSRTSEAIKLALYLNQPGLLIGLHGASQTGKTLLCEALLASKNPVTLPGQTIRTSGDMWDRLRDALRVPGTTTLSETQSHTNSSDESASGGAGVSTPLISIGGKAQRSRGSEISDNLSKSAVFSPATRHSIEEALAASRRPIIIDDFHWIPEKAQRDILIDLKHVGRGGTTVVLVTVQESALAPLHTLPEFQNRYELVEAPSWKPASLALIARKGFNALNMQVSDNIVQALAGAARRNPLMMQKLCWEYCFEQGVGSTFDKPTPARSEYSYLERVYRKIAESQYRFYSTIVERGERRFERGGKRLNFREMAFVVLSNIEAQQRVSPTNLNRRLQRFLDGPVPDDVDLAEELRAVSDDFAQYGTKSPFRYDTTDDRCVILAPEFRMAIRYHLAPKFGYQP